MSVRNTELDFWARVEISDGCWRWTGCQSGKNKPYGVVNWNGVQFRAHRLAWQLTNGTTPGALVVRHTCDNPRCVRPSHLLLGTPADNNRDMWERGRCAKGEQNGARKHPERLARGERNGVSKLTDEAVREIRASRLPLGHFAKRYGVSEASISGVRRGRLWRHVVPNDRRDVRHIFDKLAAEASVQFAQAEDADGRPMLAAYTKVSPNEASATLRACFTDDECASAEREGWSRIWSVRNDITPPATKAPDPDASE